MNNLPRITMTFCITLLLVACSNSDEQEKLNRYIESVKKNPPNTIEALPEFAEYHAYQYQPGDRRDPFQAFIDKSRVASTQGPDINRKKEPLEAYPLDALKMVGVLEHGDDRWGLIAAPDGMVYKIKSGNYIGQNYGKVVKIENGVVQLEESVRVSGVWKQKPAVLKITEK